MTLKPAIAARREKILDAGQALMLSHGLAGVRMEAIARTAGVAKPTLYSYFPDKDAVYAAIVARLIAAMRAAFVAGMARDGDLAARIAGALSAKSKLVFRLLEGSPHAAALMGEKGRLAASEMQAFEQMLEREITEALAASGHETPRQYAQLILACADGILRRAARAEEIGPALRLMVGKLLA